MEPLAPTAATNEAVPLSKALAEFEATMAPVGLSIASLLDDAIQSTVIATEPPITVQIDGAALPEAEATAAPSATTRVEARHSAFTAGLFHHDCRENQQCRLASLVASRSRGLASIHNRLQSAAAAAIEQMTEGLLSLCDSGGKVGPGELRQRRGRHHAASRRRTKAPRPRPQSRPGRCQWNNPNLPKAWACCRKSAGKRHSAAGCRWKKS